LSDAFLGIHQVRPSTWRDAVRRGEAMAELIGRKFEEE
jgi:hypothetical protein